MGRPRQSHKDLPIGLYRDAAGRITLKVFTAELRKRMGGKSTISFGRDLAAARIKWAEVYGFRELRDATAGTLSQLFNLFLTEDLVSEVPGPDGKLRPKYATRTQREYGRQAKLLLVPYGARKYARSEAEAANGGFFRTMDVSAHIKSAIAAGKAPQGNRDAALLSSVFRYAKECGLTEYNPCLGATRAPEYSREREVADELYLAVYEQCDPFLQVWMDLATMVGSRVSDILRILDTDWKAAEGLRAIPAKAKPGQARKKQLFEATPDLVEVMERARLLKRDSLAAEARRKERQARERGETIRVEPISSLFLLPNPETGQPYTLSGFESKFDRARLRLARLRLGPDSTQDQRREFVRELDLHMHDHRARAGDDAHDRGEDVADFLGHTSDAMARRRYLRREKVLTPNPRIKARG